MTDMLWEGPPTVATRRLQPTTEQVLCETCGTPFERVCTGGGRKRFCTDACRPSAPKCRGPVLITTVCWECEVEFSFEHRRGTKREFCSDSCRETCMRRRKIERANATIVAYTEKACSKCGIVKSLSAFDTDLTHADGCKSACMTCRLIDGRKRNPLTSGLPITYTCMAPDCGQPFTRVKQTGRAPMYCSPHCKGSAGTIAARARKKVRRCACGSTDVGRTGKAVCPACQVDRRSSEEQAFRRGRGRTFKSYGITQDDFDAMVKEQNGRCAMCQTTEPGGPHKIWAIDHCHTTGATRGLLCTQCNIGIGNLRDDPEVMLAGVSHVLRLAARESVEVAAMVQLADEMRDRLRQLRADGARAHDNVSA